VQCRENGECKGEPETEDASSGYDARFDDMSEENTKHSSDLGDGVHLPKDAGREIAQVGGGVEHG